MPRPKRIDFAGARHHVMNRGARRQPLFLDDACAVEFLSLLAEFPSRFGLKVHGYALMPNHFHLMIESRCGSLAEGMSYLQGEYSRRVNLSRKWDGPLFRGRYNNRVVTSDRHWRHLLAYLHLNPLRAHLVNKLDDARWTSHEAYVRAQARPPWLTTDELLATFGSVEAYKRYTLGFWQGRVLEPENFGQAAFEGKTRAVTEVTPRAKPIDGAARLELALAEVAASTGVAVEDLQRTRFGPGGHPVRLVALWWLVKERGISVVDAGRALSMRPAAVSKSLARVRARWLQSDPVRDQILELRSSARCEM